MARKQSTNKKPRRDLYQEITDRILGLLDRGVVPWRNPIRRQGGGGWPKNLTTDKRYRGVNVFLLAVTAFERGFGSDYWLTFRQAKQNGGSIRKGEKASLVTFWKLYDKTDAESGEEFKLPVLRHYNVFNAEQCEGIEAPDVLPADPGASSFDPLPACDEIVAGYANGPTIEHRVGPARYLPSQDRVLIPDPSAFETQEAYFGVLYHEFTHSVGHSTRLDRGLDNPEATPAPFGSAEYGKEELIAEMGAAFLAAVGGISPPTIEQSASYIDNWKKQIAGDTRMVVTAAAAAQKSADWILGETFGDVASDKPTPPTPRDFPAPDPS
ncbi:DNA primase TraC [Pseudobythopirellula maris]|uniref:DNA primase TraC n=1 Tax=Pseudobythopirellula maris TaxID=2527991 RepID=A0A5C5ZHW2_9BACT|nr:ArdC-like ssDNA-binding domain-containing protein [Pseudobythopirellula maris]TWT86720.1 DNA primase TraC [Pseudobythopirellula maris]